MELTLETFVDGAWEHAATLDLVGDAHRSPAELSYEQAYVYKHDPLFPGEVIDRRALSLRLPLTLSWDRLATWPPFVLDFLPQGHARQVIAKSLDIDPDSASADGPLLLRDGRQSDRQYTGQGRLGARADPQPRLPAAGPQPRSGFCPGRWLFGIGGHVCRRGLGIEAESRARGRSCCSLCHPMASGIRTPWWLTTTRRTT